ncbi:unknown [Salmonella phage FelixO1]|uniref:Uncharacterized protein n=1 Tax=Salmonella phage Felix O1 (isolate Felix O1-VT1) TaxID=1283336 RepID=Q6KGG3_BPFO1|nr:unknown [Salmonella phage FelixO1]
MYTLSRPSTVVSISISVPANAGIAPTSSATTSLIVVIFVNVRNVVAVTTIGLVLAIMSPSSL